MMPAVLPNLVVAASEGIHDRFQAARRVLKHACDKAMLRGT